MHAVVFAHHIARNIQDRARIFRPRLLDKIAIVTIAHETNILTIGLVVRGDGKRLGNGARLHLMQRPQGKTQHFQLLLSRKSQKVALILAAIDGFGNHRHAFHFAAPHVVTRHQRINAHAARQF
jgi:hypothetical protein